MEKFACQPSQGERTDSLSDQAAALFSIIYFQNFFNSEGFGIINEKYQFETPLIYLQDETLPCLGEPFPISLPEKVEQIKIFDEREIVEKYFAGNNYSTL